MAEELKLAASVSTCIGGVDPRAGGRRRARSVMRAIADFGPEAMWGSYEAKLVSCSATPSEIPNWWLLTNDVREFQK
jgi:hypothetical protein